MQPDSPKYLEDIRDAAAYSLPSGLHTDPADRILAATARMHDLTLLTADERILEYGGVRTFDART